jgi:hypothetical protein
MFEENGDIKPEYAERYARNVGKLYKELIWFGRMLKNGRQELALKPIVR